MPCREIFPGTDVTGETTDNGDDGIIIGANRELHWRGLKPFNIFNKNPPLHSK
jgi:hypothetical protein